MPNLPRDGCCWSARQSRRRRRSHRARNRCAAHWRRWTRGQLASKTVGVAPAAGVSTEATSCNSHVLSKGIHLRLQASQEKLPTSIFAFRLDAKDGLALWHNGRASETNADQLPQLSVAQDVGDSHLRKTRSSPQPWLRRRPRSLRSSTSPGPQPWLRRRPRLLRSSASPSRVVSHMVKSWDKRWVVEEVHRWKGLRWTRLESTRTGTGESRPRQ